MTAPADEPLAALCPEPLEVGPAPSTRWLREQELELRALLLRDARADDNFAQEYRESTVFSINRVGTLADVEETCHWPLWHCLDELRLVERRLHQMGEDK